MAELDTSVEHISIVDEMQKSYLDYAMSVIVSRALPDVRDGLKPVHRRILYGARALGVEWNRPYKKSARIVGDVMGKFHPHGDSAIYDALARMAQDFSMRVPLIDGQGNFGSMDGDKPAAMRYTEARMSRAASFLLQDIDKDTVDFAPNYDGNETEPTVLPARYPNLLVNGVGGIAVGMATNVPPHNLCEVIDGCLHLVDNPLATVAELSEFVLGPDFPTGGIAIGKGGMASAFETGRGSVIVRGKAEVQERKDGREMIVISEIPFQVNKSKLVERIAELVRDKIVEGISDLRDESDREGVRVVVELKRDANGDVVLNQLYKHTSLQSSFAYNMLAIDRGRPKQMNLRDILMAFLGHREEVITRRTRYNLNKARQRAHLLVGLAIAVANIDDIIKIVRNAPDPQTAKTQLMERDWAAESAVPLIELLGEAYNNQGTYQFSEHQAQAILDLRLHRLTGLERDKINEEANEIAEHIRSLINILANRHVLLGLMKEEMVEVKEMFGTPRRTEIMEGGADFNMEDFIKPEEVVVTISTDGYVKRQPIDEYRAQRRGGKGKTAAKMKDEEQLETFFVANTHDPLLVFTSVGKVYKLKVYELPLGSRGGRGKAFVNLLPIEKDEKVNRLIPVPREKEEWENQVLMFATHNGIVRKTPLTAFANVHSGGIKGMALNDGDELVSVAMSHEEHGDVLISTANGSAVRFDIASLRTIASRTALGVKGVTLRDGDHLVSMDILTEETQYVLSVTENGYGKRTTAEDFPAKSRGTMGVIAIKTSDRNGKVVASLPVNDGDQVMMITPNGQVIRMDADAISLIGRNTQGVRLFKTDGETVAYATAIPAHLLEDDDEELEEGETIEGEVVEAAVAADATEATEITETAEDA